MSVRRYRINPTSLELEEIPLNVELYCQLVEQFAQRVGRSSEQLGHSLEAFGIAVRSVQILSPDAYTFITPVPNPVRISLELILTAMHGVWRPGEVSGDYSPGGDAQHRELHLVLLDLIKAGRREDYEYMARYEAHVPPDKIDELWERTRRMHRLDP